MGEGGVILLAEYRHILKPLFYDIYIFYIF